MFFFFGLTIGARQSRRPSVQSNHINKNIRFHVSRKSFSNVNKVKMCGYHWASSIYAKLATYMFYPHSHFFSLYIIRQWMQTCAEPTVATNSPTNTHLQCSAPPKKNKKQKKTPPHSPSSRLVLSRLAEKSHWFLALRCSATWAVRVFTAWHTHIHTLQVVRGSHSWRREQYVGASMTLGFLATPTQGPSVAFFSPHEWDFPTDRKHLSWSDWTRHRY